MSSSCSVLEEVLKVGGANTCLNLTGGYALQVQKYRHMNSYAL